ncbi:hypothetical protein GIB67_010737, partial [Kingdonia uniflora]
MSLEEEKYEGSGDEVGSESDYSEGHVSQLCFLSGKKWKNNFEEVVNVSIEPPLPLPQNYEARDFRQLTQPDGNGHLSTSVATTSARVGFKCKSVLVKLRKIYVILIERIYAIILWRCLIWELEELDSTRVVMSNYRFGKQGLMIDFGSAILGHLYYFFDQASRQEYHCYKYCKIGHHILIDNRNMKDALKREVIIAGNISRKRVLLQCPFGGYKWYLGDRCWAQLEHRALPYDPPEKLHCFPSSDVARSLRAASWIEAQHYIVGRHIDYDAYWRHVSHGALMSDIARGLKSNGKIKREHLKRGLHVGGVRGDEHLKEENIDQSSTDYSDDDVIDEIKMEILRNQDEIEEFEEAKSLRIRV